MSHWNKRKTNNNVLQARFAVPHSSLTIGLVGLGLGLGWVRVGVPKKFGGWVD